jgi:hypothetical protein
MARPITGSPEELMQTMPRNAMPNARGVVDADRNWLGSGSFLRRRPAGPAQTLWNRHVRC